MAVVQVQDVQTLVELARSQAAGLLQRHDAFGQLVGRFQDMAYGYAYCLLGERAAAQDAAQDAFLTAYRQLDQLRQAGAFPGWLKRIVFSQCSRVRRLREPLLEEQAEGATEPVSRDPSPADLAVARERGDFVRAAIQALPEGERLATVLFYIDGYSQAEVATFLEAPVTAVRKRLERARNHLREAMVEMVRDDLGSDRPSRDESFAQRVRLAAMLDEAAQQGELAMFEALLVDGYDPNVRGQDGLTLLHWAVRRRSFDAVGMLLKCGADPNARDRAGHTPLQDALRLRAINIADLLRSHGASE